MNSLTIILVILCSLKSTLGLADAVAGPSLSYQGFSLSPIKHHDGTATKTKLARRRLELRAITTLPTRFYGGDLIIRGNALQEKNTLSPADADRVEGGPTVLSSADLGLLYFSPAQTQKPRFFILAARYFDLKTPWISRPMHELSLGADFGEDALPFAIKIDSSDSVHAVAAAQFLKFPGFHKLTVLLGYKITRASGWYLDVAYPSHAMLGFNPKDQAWAVYTGARVQSRYAFFTMGESMGWTDGYTLTTLMGLRRSVVKPLYFAVEAGLQKEKMRYMSYEGRERSVHQSEFRPWAKVAFETWVDLPN